MKISFISTVFNEQKSINSFLKSIFSQTRLPNEIIIVDGGSSDRTVANIKYQISNIKNSRVKFRVLVKKGNRAVGRNEAIKNATGDIIVCSDSGCILDKNWIENITQPFMDSRFRGNDSVDGVDVVAGYYKGKPHSVFEKCLVPYVLVMEDKIDPKNFLPASRSMAFKKSIWVKVGGFSEKFSHNEDYVFAKNLKKVNANIIFAKKAIVYWIPRSNLKDAFVMFYRFALGDSESRIVRPKVILIFLRYIFFIVFSFSFLAFHSNFILYTLYFIFALYILWSIVKNYKYIKDWKATFYLPLIQFASDIAVILGTINGLLTKKLRILIEGLFYICVIYVLILLNFRKLRSLFSPPKIGEDGIVGYAQYFGYPLYFETIIFFVFILSPIIVFFILSKIRKYGD